MAVGAGAPTSPTVLSHRPREQTVLLRASARTRFGGFRSVRMFLFEFGRPDGTYVVIKIPKSVLLALIWVLLI